MTTDAPATLEAGSLPPEPSRITDFAIKCGCYLALLCLYLLITVGFTLLELKIQNAILGPDDFSLKVLFAVFGKIYCTYVGLEAASNHSSIGESVVDGYCHLLGFCIAWLIMTTALSGYGALGGIMDD